MWVRATATDREITQAARQIRTQEILNLYLDETERTSEARRDADERILAIIAGGTHTLFGKPVEFDVRWPEGPPMRMTEAEVRAWCAERLAQSRHR